MADEIELTSDRETVVGTVPYQPRLTMRLNHKTRVRVGYFMLRPRTVVLALAAALAAAWWALRLLGRAR